MAFTALHILTNQLTLDFCKMDNIMVMAFFNIQMADSTEAIGSQEREKVTAKPALMA